MTKEQLVILAAWLVIINIIAFCLYGIDKKRAKKGQWRISEKTLLLSAVFGGSIGALLGMYVFRHKTRHWYFRWGFPLLLLLQVALVIWLSWKLGLRWNG